MRTDLRRMRFGGNALRAAGPERRPSVLADVCAETSQDVLVEAFQNYTISDNISIILISQDVLYQPHSCIERRDSNLHAVGVAKSRAHKQPASSVLVKLCQC